MQAQNIIDLITSIQASSNLVLLAKPEMNSSTGMKILGLDLDAQLIQFYKFTNGCRIGSTYIYGDKNSKNDIVCHNSSARLIRDDITFYDRLILFAGTGFQSTELATMPDKANQHGQQPVVLVDTNEEPFILPIASNVNRALFLIFKRELRLELEEEEDDEPFPYDVVSEICEDKELIEALKIGFFDDIAIPSAEYEEWVSLLINH